MKKRVISALIMLPLLVFVYLGGLYLFTISLVITYMALFEFYRAFGNINIYPKKYLSYIAATCLYAIIYWGEFIENSDKKVYAHLLLLWVFGVVFLGLFQAVLSEGKKIYDGLILSLGLLYIAFMFSHLILITQIPKYSMFTWLVFISALGSDACALFVGSAFGKHKLCPDISPHKTYEGCIGGIVGAAILCGVFGLIFLKDIWPHCVIIGIIGSYFSQCGDLIASLFKRKTGIKDYGNLIPGHGGVLDRFDSVIVTAPFVYYYILVVLRP